MGWEAKVLLIAAAPADDFERVCVVPQSIWTRPVPPGAEGTPDDVDDRGERDADFGERLRRVANRKVLASQRGARDTYEPGRGETYELPLVGTVRRAA